MPRIRWAIRSGWKRSSCSSFSPVEAKRIGLPVTALTLSAAPPRASPSSLLITTPSNSVASANCSATLTASWPVIASTTSSTSWGRVRFLIWTSSVHQLRVDVEAAGGVDDQHVLALGARLAERPLGDVDGIAVGALRVDRSPWPARRGASAARPRPDAGCRRRRRRPACPARAGAAPASRSRSSCPSPAGPPSGSRSGPWRRRRGRGRSRPSARSSCSLTTLTTIWPGSRLASTPSPIAFSRTPATKPLVTLKLTSASSRARRISRIALSTSASVSFPRERRSESVPWRRSLRAGRTSGLEAYGPTSSARELLRVERAQVLDALSPTPISFTGIPSSPAIARRDPALGRAVELGQDDAGHVDRLAEDLRLAQAVLAGRRVDDDQGLVTARGRCACRSRGGPWRAPPSGRRAVVQAARPCRSRTTSAPRDSAAAIASKTTAPASWPGLGLDDLARPRARPRSSSCSTAAAR